MTDDTYMFYEPRTGTMLAIGKKKDIEKMGKQYMEQMMALMQMLQEQKDSENKIVFH